MVACIVPIPGENKTVWMPGVRTRMSRFSASVSAQGIIV